jgi:hypothetical protein
MTSPLYLSPQVTRARVANKLWVNKAPNAGNSTSPSTMKARQVHPLTKHSGPKHKAQHPYTRRIR